MHLFPFWKPQPPLVFPELGILSCYSLWWTLSRPSRMKKWLSCLSAFWSVTLIFFTVTLLKHNSASLRAWKEPGWTALHCSRKWVLCHMGKRFKLYYNCAAWLMYLNVFFHIDLSVPAWGVPGIPVARGGSCPPFPQHGSSYIPPSSLQQGIFHSGPQCESHLKETPILKQFKYIYVEILVLCSMILLLIVGTVVSLVLFCSCLLHCF